MSMCLENSSNGCSITASEVTMSHTPLWQHVGLKKKKNPDNSYIVCHHIGTETSHFADILKKAGKAAAFTLGTPRGLWVKVKTSGRACRREVKTEVTDGD